MSWSQSVDEALCFGWIDGVRRSIDVSSYAIRFTPRKPKSVWSAVNIAKVAELTAKGLMQPAGIAAFAKREESKSKIYAYENEAKQFSDEFEKEFRANEKAWEFFQNQANWYKKQMKSWVMTAKQEATRKSRLEKLIMESENEGKEFKWLIVNTRFILTKYISNRFTERIITTINRTFSLTAQNSFLQFIRFREAAIFNLRSLKKFRVKFLSSEIV